MSKILMHGAVIHDKRRETASTYFGTQSETGNVEVALQQAKKRPTSHLTS